MSRRVRRRRFERVVIWQPSSGTIINLPTRYVFPLEGPNEEEEYATLASGSKTPLRRTNRVQVPVTHRELALMGEVLQRSKCPVKAAFLGPEETDNWLWLEETRLQIRDPDIAAAEQADKVLDLHSKVFFPGIWESNDLIGGVPWQDTESFEVTELDGNPYRLEPTGNQRKGYRGPGWEVNDGTPAVDLQGKASGLGEASLIFQFPVWDATLKIDTLLGFSIGNVVLNALDYSRSVLASATGQDSTLTLPRPTYYVEVRVGSSSARPKITVADVGENFGFIAAGGVTPDCTPVEDPDFIILPKPNEAPEWEQKEDLVYGLDNTPPTWTTCEDQQVSFDVSGGGNSPPTWTACNDHSVTTDLTEPPQNQPLEYTPPSYSDTKRVYTANEGLSYFDYPPSNFNNLFDSLSISEIAVDYDASYIFVPVSGGIERYDLTGGNNTTLQSGTGKTPVGVCVDPVTETLYVSYSGETGIFWLNYDATASGKVIDDAGSNYSLFCAPDGGDGGYLFGISEDADELARWPLAGGSKTVLIDVSAKSWNIVRNLHGHLGQQYLFFQSYGATTERKIRRSNFKGGSLTTIFAQQAVGTINDETYWTILEDEKKWAEVEKVEGIDSTLSERNLDGNNFSTQNLSIQDTGDFVNSVASVSGGTSTSTPPANSFTLTVQSSKVDSNLSNFPVYVDLSDMPSGFWGSVADDGGNIRVENSSGTELPREVVYIDTDNKRGYIYFEADSVSSSSNTDFTIKTPLLQPGYSPTDTNGRNAVWANGFHRVYHFADDPASGTLTDSTGNADGTLNGSMTTGDRVFTGATGVRIDFDGSDDWALLPLSHDWSGDNAFTFEGVVEMSTLPSNDSFSYFLMANDDANGASTPAVFQNDDSIAAFNGNNGGNTVDSGVDLTADTPFNIATAHDGTDFRIFVQGTKEATNSGFDFSPPTFDLAQFNGNLFASTFGDGLIEEMIVSTAKRSDAWLKARDSNVRNTSNFYSIS